MSKSRESKARVMDAIAVALLLATTSLLGCAVALLSLR